MAEHRRMYDSIRQMMESMPCELELRCPRSSGHRFFVFQSKNNDELQRHLTDPSITFSRRATRVTDEDICFWHNVLGVKNYLLQIWAPVTIGEKHFLTTSDQPFALTELVRGLCSYRKRCLDVLIPIRDMTTDEEGHLGPPGRVFQNGLPEVCLDVRHYTCKEYPLCGYGPAYLALPLHESSKYKRRSVLELVVNGYKCGSWEAAKLLSGNPEFTLGSRTALREIREMLRVVCKTHQLPLAQTWVSMPYSVRHKNEVRYEDGGLYNIEYELDSCDEEGSCVVDYGLHGFIEACHFCYIKKGRGVVGKAFSSKGACFCKDVSQLSIDKYSLVPSARKAGLTGCFAISLTHRACWVDYVYIVEFFFDNKTESGDPRTLIKMLKATMKEHLKDFRVASGQELGKNLFVEVIKTSPNDELDSFEIYDLTSIHGGAARAVDRGANVLTDASNLSQHGGEVVRLLVGRSHEENVNNAEQYNGRMERCDINKMENLKLDAPIKNVENLNVNGAEQNVVTLGVQNTNSNSSKNQRGIKRINKEYGITLADLLKHSGKKQEEVATHFGVSRSTFKRICRAHEIFRWPPRKVKHDDGPSIVAREFVQPAKEELPLPIQHVQRDLNSKPNSTQNTTSTVHNDSSMVVKVTYRDDMIRFNLSVSSGKTALEEEIAKRFRLSVGGFNIKYLDEDGDWISVVRNEDLKTCTNIIRSLGNNRVKMSVRLSQDN